MNAAFHVGENVISYLPKNNKKYDVVIGADVRVTSDDINSIYDWAEATDISITDSHNIPQLLVKNPKKLRQLSELQRLSFVATESSFATLSIHNFVRSLPKIVKITFHTISLNADQIQVIINHQKPLKGWNVHLENDGNTIVFDKQVGI